MPLLKLLQGVSKKSKAKNKVKRKHLKIAQLNDKVVF